MTKEYLLRLLNSEFKHADVLPPEQIAMAIESVAADAFAHHDQRVTELIEHNNELLDRSRKAEAEIKRLTHGLLAAGVTIGEMARVGGKT